MGAYDQYFNTPEIQNAQAATDTATKTAMEYGSSLGGLPEKLRQAVLEKFNFNKDLIEQRNKAAADYFAAPSADRVKYADIGNPMMTEKLVAQDKAALYEPWSNFNDLLTQRMGTIDRTANSLYQTAQSEYDMAKFGVDAARQKMNDLMTMAELKAKYNMDDKGKSPAEKAKDKVLIDSWLSGVDGLPGMEGVMVPTDRQSAYLEGQKLISKGFDPEVITEEIDAHYPVQAAKTGLDADLEKALKLKLGGGTSTTSQTNTSTGSLTSPVRLKDLSTGTVYQYSGYDDPDYVKDLKDPNYILN